MWIQSGTFIFPLIMLNMFEYVLIFVLGLVCKMYEDKKIEN